MPRPSGSLQGLKAAAQDPDWDDFDKLNTRQAAFYKRGDTNNPEYKRIVARMDEIAPPGYRSF